MANAAKTFRMGFAGAVFGGLVLLSIGAAEKPAAKPENVPATVSPRYNVQIIGNATFITDNQSNKLFVYENTSDELLLRSSTDLTKAGEKIVEFEKIKQR